MDLKKAQEVSPEDKGGRRLSHTQMGFLPLPSPYLKLIV